MGTVALPALRRPRVPGGAGVGGLIGPRPLAALRVAATLAHCLPVRLRIRCAGRLAVEVARPPFAPEPGAVWCTPCQFRAAVAGAWATAQQGKAVAMRGLPEGAEPAVEVGLPPGASGRPGGLWRFPADGAVRWVAAAVGPPGRMWVAAQPDLCLRVDEATGVVVASAVAEEAEEEDVVVDTLEGLVAELSVGALLADLSGRVV